jgi:opine dehydrogenase
MRRFAIVGAGNGGLAFACYLANRGGEVAALCDKRTDWLAALREAGVLRAVGPHLACELPMPYLTDDPGEAAASAPVVLVVTTANAHEEVARRLAPGLSEGQLVLLCPGYLGGSLLFRRVLEESGCGADVTVAELALLPFAARVVEPGTVAVRAIKRWVLTAAVQRRRTVSVVEQLLPSLPMLAPAQDVLEVGLNNVNPVVHVPGVLLNLGLVEAGVFQTRDFYECLRGRVMRVVEEVDRERLSVGAALGYTLPSLEEFDRKSYGGVQRAYVGGEAGTQWSEASNVPPRYLEEDVPMGLVPLVELGRRWGGRTRYSELLVELACLVQGVDYWKTGRTLDKLGVTQVDDLRGDDS